MVNADTIEALEAGLVADLAARFNGIVFALGLAALTGLAAFVAARWPEAADKPADELLQGTERAQPAFQGLDSAGDVNDGELALRR